MISEMDYDCHCSASSPNSPIVRTTRSTFSRKALRVRRARRTVSVANVLDSDSISLRRSRGDLHLRNEDIILHDQISFHCRRLQLAVHLDNLLCDRGVFGISERDAHRAFYTFEHGSSGSPGQYISHGMPVVSFVDGGHRGVKAVIEPSSQESIFSFRLKSFRSVHLRTAMACPSLRFTLGRLYGKPLPSSLYSTSYAGDTTCLQAQCLRVTSPRTSTSPSYRLALRCATGGLLCWALVQMDKVTPEASHLMPSHSVIMVFLIAASDISGNTCGLQPHTP
jgi:hypothetical protein